MKTQKDADKVLDFCCLNGFDDMEPEVLAACLEQASKDNVRRCFDLDFLLLGSTAIYQTFLNHGLSPFKVYHKTHRSLVGSLGKYENKLFLGDTVEHALVASRIYISSAQTEIFEKIKYMLNLLPSSDLSAEEQLEKLRKYQSVVPRQKAALELAQIIKTQKEKLLLEKSLEKNLSPVALKTKIKSKI